MISTRVARRCCRCRPHAPPAAQPHVTELLPSVTYSRGARFKCTTGSPATPYSTTAIPPPPLTPIADRQRLVYAARALAGLLLTPATAGAQYLDPGAASIIIQSVVAGVVAVGAGVKLYWSKIAAFFFRRRRSRQPE